MKCINIFFLKYLFIFSLVTNALYATSNPPSNGLEADCLKGISCDVVSGIARKEGINHLSSHLLLFITDFFIIPKKRIKVLLKEEFFLKKVQSLLMEDKFLGIVRTLNEEMTGDELDLFRICRKGVLNSSQKNKLNKLLFLKKVDPNCWEWSERNKLGNSPLHVLVSHSNYFNIFILDKLLMAGANINILNLKGKTPLDVALRNYVLAATKLRDRGALYSQEVKVKISEYGVGFLYPFAPCPSFLHRRIKLAGLMKNTYYPNVF